MKYAVALLMILVSGCGDLCIPQESKIAGRIESPKYGQWRCERGIGDGYINLPEVEGDSSCFNATGGIVEIESLACYADIGAASVLVLRVHLSPGPIEIAPISSSPIPCLKSHPQIKARATLLPGDRLFFIYAGGGKRTKELVTSVSGTYKIGQP